jgi:hypothetical protein
LEREERENSRVVSAEYNDDYDDQYDEVISTRIDFSATDDYGEDDPPPGVGRGDGITKDYESKKKSTKKLEQSAASRINWEVKMRDTKRLARQLHQNL